MQEMRFSGHRILSLVKKGNIAVPNNVLRAIQCEKSIPLQHMEFIKPIKKWLTSAFFNLLLTIAGALSAMVYFIVFHVLKYRYDVIRKNLSSSFPVRGEQQIKVFIKHYYRHLSDLVVEPFLHMIIGAKRRKELANYTNPELLENFYSDNRNVVLLASHYGNWEYLINLPKVVKFKVFTAFTPVSNHWLNAKLLKMRSFFGVNLIAKQYFYRGALSALKQLKRPSLVVVIADQRPAPASGKHFVSFLGQKTSAQIGAERLAVVSDAVVVYLECIKKARFHYDYTFHLVSDHSSQSLPLNITASYYNLLEKNIIRAPAHWLWSHDRWKHIPADEK